MIQANELRVGNLLNYQTAEGGVVTITTDFNAIQWATEDPKGFNLVHTPIPLTEEWLVKFGFVFGIELQDFVKGKHQFIELNCLCGYFSENDIFYYAEKTKLKYVHQLQNLYFALRGQELTPLR